MNKQPPALLALANGQIFKGHSIGAGGTSVGEIVFNTAMTGYQEILTDPSYSEQLVTLTASHIGNAGINLEDIESRQPFLKGLIVKDVPNRFSNWRAQQSLPHYLKAHKIVGISGIDTRALVRVLRDEGAQGACLMAADHPCHSRHDQLDPEEAIQRARSFRGLSGQNLASSVSTDHTIHWNQLPWSLTEGYSEGVPTQLPYHVIAVDLGVKSNLLRLLQSFGCRITLVPFCTDFKNLMALEPDGIFLSNGPGDPDACQSVIALVTELIEKKVPILGICLGYQILAIASGAKTFKMKFGHHGANHPVQSLESNEVMITSQNHGFAVQERDLPECLEVTHRSLFDDSIQGLRHKQAPIFGFQGHPEASPGPHDAEPFFDEFIQALKATQK